MNHQFTRSALSGPPAGGTRPTAGEEAAQKTQLAKRKAKRKKPRWRDRVAPAEPHEEPTEDVIDEATLTRCTRCPAHRNRAGTFRPLIGSGEHVCDDCYSREFPCTAMLDDHDQPELLRKGKRATHFVRNKIVDGVADIVGTTSQPTPDAEMQRESYPSEEECRACLERGVFRRCCGSYYCNVCYYQSGKCPGCLKEAPLTGVAAADLKPDPGKLAVGLAWALSALLVALTIVGAGLVYWNASTTPTTVWGHTCRGWLRDCNFAVCVDYDGGGGYGSAGEFLPPSQPYKVCDRASTANQVVGSACIYDQELYAWSNSRVGYDICVSSPREEGHRPRDVSSPDPLLLFSNNQSGVCVFDDDFELAVRNASAPWSDIINGDRSSACGVNNKAVERGNHAGYQPLPNSNALVFTGVHTRQATTAGLDVRHGGRVEFFLKMGPILVEGAESDCKAAFSDVILEYRTESSNWATLATYPAWGYRGVWKFVSEELPTDAWSNSTKFRFRQPYFDSLRDHWAIDDIRIWANLMPKWEASPQFEERREQQAARVKLAQCCYGSSNQCSVFEKKRTNFSEDQCDAIPGFDKSDASSRLRLCEVLVLYMCLAAGAKALYRLIALRFTRRAAKIKQGGATEIGTDLSKDADLFPRHTFHATTHLAWQSAWVVLLFGALSCTVYRLLDALRVFECLASENADDPSCETDASFVVACILAAVFDASAVGKLLHNVVCIKCPSNRKRLEVVVDLHPERGFLRVGSKTIPLSELADVKTQSPAFHWSVSLLTFLGGMPWALGYLTLPSFDLPDSLEAAVPILGYIAILRVIFGPLLFVKLYLTIEWVLTLKARDRDEFGRALLRRGLLQQFFIGATFAPVLIMISIASRRVEYVSAGDNFMLFLIYSAFGGLCGLMLGVMHGLPVIPNAKLTGWPGTCCSVSYYDRVACPCLFSCNYCGEVHSRQELLILSLDDTITLKRMLNGNLRDLHVQAKSGVG
ncbi:hypothetical protein ACHAXT_004948 [Thalassiosira profunda]